MPRLGDGYNAPAPPTADPSAYQRIGDGYNAPGASAQTLHNSFTKL